MGIWPVEGGDGRAEDCYMKRSEECPSSRWGVKGFWSHLVCLRHTATILSCQSIVWGVSTTAVSLVQSTRPDSFPEQWLVIKRILFKWSLLGANKAWSTPRLVSFRALIQIFRRAPLNFTYGIHPTERQLKWLITSRKNFVGLSSVIQCAIVKSCH